MIIESLLRTDPYERASAGDLLKEHIVREKMKVGKSVESLESSVLLKTIRPAKNMVCLTDKLPQPNYQPIRYRSYFQLKDHSPPRNIYGNSMQELPQFGKSLNKSHQLNTSQIKSGRTSLEPKRRGRDSQFANPEWLPKIKGQMGTRLP